MSLVAAAMLMAAAPQPAELAGLYVTRQMEVAGAIELQAGGRFRYRLDYGAVSEGAEGDWTFDGTTVRLTSNPMPKQPAFTLVRDEPAPAGQLFVALDDGDVSWTPLDVELMLDGAAEPVLVSAGEGGAVAVPAGRRATAVKMLLPVYDTGGEPVRLSPERGHRLLFKLEANDMGKAALKGEALVVDGNSLVIRRYEAELIFQRAEQ